MGRVKSVQNIFFHLLIQKGTSAIWSEKKKWSDDVIRQVSKKTTKLTSVAPPPFLPLNEGVWAASSSLVLGQLPSRYC